MRTGQDQVKAESGRDEMQEIDRREIDEDYASGEDLDDLEPAPFSALTRKRAVTILVVLLALVLMAVVPPLINVSRYRRQIATSIGLSLGRPVHIDSVTLNMLPMPGFTLENFVVDEDPAFGAEPVIRANEVRARLRMNSLWRRRVEFSRISLTDPSVNLVHLPDGRWNLESILVQASRMPAAPTAQKGAGEAPRFPYIEATGARVNVKRGLEKLPLSLVDAEFALWLPEPKQWHLRLTAHPARTDTAATDTGTLRVEGTLGQAARLADVPVDLSGDWSPVPLGSVSKVLMGSDAGLRGEMTLHAGVHGTMGLNQVETRLELRGVRRADFVPARMMDADVVCRARATGSFHALERLQCGWPPDASASGMALTGTVPDVFHPGAGRFAATVKDVPAAGVLDVLRAASSRIGQELRASGMVSGQFDCCGLDEQEKASEFTVSKARLQLGSGAPILDQDVSGGFAGGQVVIQPVGLSLGGKEPALFTIAADRAGYTMRLSGMVLRSKLGALVAAVPPIGDGLDAVLPEATDTNSGPEVPVRVDLSSRRAWGGAQSWETVAPVKAPPRVRGRRR